MAAGVDLHDRMGNAAPGVHVATMGGLWQAPVTGFGGARPEGDVLRIDPRLPPDWEGSPSPCSGGGLPARCSSCASPSRRHGRGSRARGWRLLAGRPVPDRAFRSAGAPLPAGGGSAGCCTASAATPLVGSMPMPPQPMPMPPVDLVDRGHRRRWCGQTTAGSRWGADRRRLPAVVTGWSRSQQPAVAPDERQLRPEPAQPPRVAGVGHRHHDQRQRVDEVVVHDRVG